LLKQTLAGLVLTCLVSLPVFADTGEDLRVFSDFGIGFRIGGAFLEKPLARSFDALFAVGVETEITVLSYQNSHYLIIPVSYMKPIPRLSDGSEQIVVDTLYHLVDIGLEYDFDWSYFSMGLGAGASLMVVTTETQIFDLNEPVLVSDDRYGFPDKTVKTRDRESGVTPGPFVNLEFGFDMGRVLGGRDGLFEVKGAFQYVRREVRNELYCWMTLYLRPSVYWH
jgi:hypothetical protein